MLAQITVEEAARSVSDPAEKARLELIAPFVEAAARVLQQECGETVVKGTVFRVRSPQTTNDVSAMIAVTGKVTGLVIYSMSSETGRHFASRMMGGEPVPTFDEMAQSAVAELANIITGQAGIALEKAGFPNDMSPPMLLCGHGSSIATFNLTRLIVPLVVSTGEFNIDIAIKEV
ncbi:MAG: chemotaxis protein CheX [Dehalococcoidia bacterium]